MSCRVEADRCTEHFDGLNTPSRFDGQHTDEGEPVCEWWAWMFSHDGDCAGCERG